jgi:hypothetical protein
MIDAKDVSLEMTTELATHENIIVTNRENDDFDANPLKVNYN